MTNTAPQTAASIATRLNAQLVKTTGKGDAKRKFYTRLGSAFAHKDGKRGFNMVLNVIPNGDGQIMLFAPKDQVLDPAAPETLGIFVTEGYDKDGEAKTAWHRVGTARKTKNGGAYTVYLDATPIAVNGEVKLVLLEPREQDGASAADGSDIPEQELDF
ncbi:hypothetical protein [Deinococcus soli (ex Cha et al. 2016)]|uniref:Uncharacterized protein n=2 Tax=Deinococcus soli (ex Cha et al. 2016) TaxID=1309411 RepID=A0AAE3XBR5_9DEIO|nr:hypothetical protein [Deinococcus soli (ex Cha et al. 2016)]MDR6218577.1 hypothetical protein [Deinococcus soli (ex Cha et al. 2016)]MDR6328374.1 hypothetical protein [Deinococcus soli (ex Cha et al. 2016)]MDR6752985.1 hypothetical protein [Deinococcus soli (ex Cha et al. 2016)]